MEARIKVSGTATLAGTLQVAPVAYTPGNNDQYNLLTAAAGVTGTFDTIDAPAFVGATPGYGVPGMPGYDPTPHELKCG